MPKQRFGLGRGLDALIPSGTSPTQRVPSVQPPYVDDDDILYEGDLATSAMFEIPCDAIAFNPQQPRTRVGEEDRELLDSGELDPRVWAAPAGAGDGCRH